MAIQQKLHTKLVQKLILTPSLQQAIKLLPMSTLELADLLNQEVVENPMLEEVPTEDLQPTEQAAQAREDRGRGQGEGRLLGRQRLRVLLRRLPRRRLPGARAAGGQRAPADREHARHLVVALRSSAVAALAAVRRRQAARDRVGDHRQPERRRHARRLAGRDRGHGPVADRGRRTRPEDHPELRSDRRGRARSAGVPAAADQAHRPRRDAHREDRHRAPAAAAGAQRAGDRQAARHVDRGSEGAHRGHPPPGSRSPAAATTPRSRTTSSPTSTS